MKPFRWNLKKAEQLGSLIEGEPSESYPGFEEDLRKCAARIIAFSDDCDLVFVGRSPESAYDYLSGILEGSRWEAKLHLLNISLYFTSSITNIRTRDPKTYRSLKDHFEQVGIAPRSLINGNKRFCFVDLVSEGGTFGLLCDFLFAWCEEENLDQKALRAKIRFTGITCRKKTSPNTWRWQQQQEWVGRHQITAIKNVSVLQHLYLYIGNWQEKVTPTNPPDRWSSKSILLPPREEDHLKALRRAHDLYHRGREERDLFSTLLAREIEMRENWFRGLVSELRQ